MKLAAGYMFFLGIGYAGPEGICCMMICLGFMVFLSEWIDAR